MRRTPILLLAASTLLLVGCPDTSGLYDFDGDGFIDVEDCGPEDPEINPDAPDVYGDGVDSNCDGLDGLDADGDGFPGNEDLQDQPELWDCNDSDPATYPGAEDLPDDGVDQDCDGLDLVDADGDGHPDGVSDCDDSDETVYLDAPELPDGQDNDCDGTTDEGTELADDDGDGSCEGYDLDGDGTDEDVCSDGTEPGDCDDADPGLNLSDIDQDGATTCDEPADCDDFNQAVHPGADEACNGEDDDCDGAVAAGEADVDMDGYMICEGDCQDSNAAVHPGDTDGDGYTLCDPVPDCDDDNPALTPADLDLDGDSSCDGDCDDTDPAVYQGADEQCNGVDDNCDGAVPADEVDADGDLWLACEDCDDGDPLLWGLDADGDGLSMCDDDCDDANSAVYPGAYDGWGNGQDEDCSGEDGIDWDGDGAVGNAMPPDLSTPAWDCDDSDPALNRQDVDGDGIDTCAATPDCDDGDTNNFPGNAEDPCDGLDTDCVGDPLEVDDDGDGWLECEGDCDDGDPALNLSDEDADGYTTCGGDCDDLDPLFAPGQWDPPGDSLDIDCDGTDYTGLESAWWRGLGEAGADKSGSAVAYLGDVDGDGLGDIAIAAWNNAEAGTAAGKVYVVFGSTVAVAGPLDLAVADCRITGESPGDHFGIALAAAGDVDGDGLDDLLIGAHYGDGSAVDSGRAYLFFGSTLAAGGALSAAQADVFLDGEAANDFAGASVASDDIDGDGIPDLLVGAPGADVSFGEGKAYVVNGASLPTSGPFDLGLADAVLVGEWNSSAGWAVAFMDDVEGDGLPEVVVGASHNADAGHDAGKTYVVLNSSLATLTSSELLLESADAAFLGEAADDLSGATLSAAGDVDADGLGDLLVGAWRNDLSGLNSGRAYLVLGSAIAAGGTAGLGLASSVVFLGGPGDYLGRGVAPAGDIDGDSLGDVIVTSLATDGGPMSGTTGIFFGSSLAVGGSFVLADADAVVVGVPNDGAGLAVAGGDLNGDGIPDIIVGASLSDEVATQAGRTAVLFGPP